MYPIIAKAIAEEQAADLRRAADAYRRIRGIRKHARAAARNSAVAAVRPPAAVPAPAPVPATATLAATGPAPDRGSQGTAPAPRMTPNWTPAERRAAITGRRTAAPLHSRRPASAPQAAVPGQRQRAGTVAAGSRSDCTPAC
jgi:hypothetical protein